MKALDQREVGKEEGKEQGEKFSTRPPQALRLSLAVLIRGSLGL